MSQDVRAGLMTREEGFAIANKIDPMKPEALKEYLELTGYTEEEFYDILKSQRVAKNERFAVMTVGVKQNTENRIFVS